MASTSTAAGGPAAPASSYSTDPALYIYTSLTAGSSHIVTATSRLETILRANRVPFKAIDIATDDKARMLWGRRAGKDEAGRLRKLPGLVQMGLVLGDLVEIEDWNEYGELKQHVTIYYDEFTQPTKAQADAMPQPLRRGPAKPAATTTTTTTTKTAGAVPPPAPPMPEKKAGQAQEGKGVVAAVAGTAAAAAKVVALPIRSIAEEAAAKANQVRLQALREKVYGKGGKPEGEKKEEGEESEKKEEESEKKEEGKEVEPKEEGSGAEEQTTAAATAPTAIAITGTPASIATGPVPQGAAGMQSPTTGAWKRGDSTDDVLRTLQSPTSTSWKPTDVDQPITSYRGSVVKNASEDEIRAVEQAETIEEEEEEDDEEDEEKDEEEEDEEEEDEEEEDEEEEDEEEEDEEEEDEDEEREEDTKTEKKPDAKTDVKKE